PAVVPSVEERGGKIVQALCVTRMVFSEAPTSDLNHRTIERYGTLRLAEPSAGIGQFAHAAGVRGSFLAQQPLATRYALLRQRNRIRPLVLADKRLRPLTQPLGLDELPAFLRRAPPVAFDLRERSPRVRHLPVLVAQ